jgi:hypothetical protein
VIEHGRALRGYKLLACIGNTARVVSGEAKGAFGTVTGHHVGVEIDFNQKILEKLCIGDKILIKSYGQGLKLLDYPDIKVMNLDPTLLDFMRITETNYDPIEVPVTCEIPAMLMGSGMGSICAATEDCDIGTADKILVKKYKLDQLRLGDIVAISDFDTSYGRIYKRGAVTIGIIVHGDCVIAGHGPGATTLLTSTKGKILYHIDANANIANYLNIGTRRNCARD